MQFSDVGLDTPQKKSKTEKRVLNNNTTRNLLPSEHRRPKKSSKRSGRTCLSSSTYNENRRACSSLIPAVQVSINGQPRMPREKTPSSQATETRFPKLRRRSIRKGALMPLCIVLISKRAAGSVNPKPSILTHTTSDRRISSLRSSHPHLGTSRHRVHLLRHPQAPVTPSAGSPTPPSGSSRAQRPRTAARTRGPFCWCSTTALPAP